MAQQRLRRHLSSDELSRCVGMLEGGCTQTHVANVLGVSQSVVSRAWTRYHAVGTAVRRHAGGRQRATTPREDRFLVVQACRNRFGSAQTLRSDLLNATGTNVCIQTIRNRLHDVNLRARRPCIRVPLTQEHRRRRLAWAQNHVNWTVADWTPVLFSDESRFCLDHIDGRARVWRRPGDRYQDACIVQHDRYGGGSLMVWGGISMAGRTDLLVLQQGSMTAQRYRDEVIDVHVRPYAGAIGDDFILMDDNAPPHRARIVQQYLEQETIVRMEWPARSPDCNPIEHLWDVLQLAVARRPQQPRSLRELENALVAEWNAVSQIQIQRLIRSMRRRCQAVIAARGSHTRY
jgi:transposase